MGRKIIKKDEVSYVCEKCNNEMFKKCMMLKNTVRGQSDLWSL